MDWAIEIGEQRDIVCPSHDALADASAADCDSSVMTTLDVSGSGIDLPG